MSSCEDLCMLDEAKTDRQGDGQLHGGLLRFAGGKRPTQLRPVKRLPPSTELRLGTAGTGLGGEKVAQSSHRPHGQFLRVRAGSAPLTAYRSPKTDPTSSRLVLRSRTLCNILVGPQDSRTG